MTLPPRVEPTGDPDEGRTETFRKTPKTPPAPQRRLNNPPGELMMLKGDLVRSLNSIKQQYREGELGDDEVEAVVEAAAVIRAIADGVTE